MNPISIVAGPAATGSAVESVNRSVLSSSVQLAATPLTDASVIASSTAFSTIWLVGSTTSTAIDT